MAGRARRLYARSNAATTTIPVVFMTARAQSSDLEHFRSLGAAGLIPKPFDPMTLAASVRGYVRPDEWLDAMRKAFLRRVKDDAPATLDSGMDSPP